MNTANLQLQGLLMAVAQINNALVRKGLLSVQELDTALQAVEANLLSEERLTEDMSQANRDAACFPVRFLQAANNAQGGAEIPPYGELTRLVGKTKDPHAASE